MSAEGKDDTGAQGNILPVRTYPNMFPYEVDDHGKPTQLNKSYVHLTAYNKSRIRQYGTIMIPCRYDWFETEFYIADTPHKLTVQTDAVPVKHPQRRAPIYLRDKIKQELDRMQVLEVIRPVSEPTDWVSSITYPEKASGDLRICIDPKDLNSALKRGQHHTPTVEELTHKLSNAKVFSKLDAKSG